MDYFVTENDVKDNYNINKNVDWDSIKPNVEVGAIEHVRPILGYTFFNDLLVKYNASNLDAEETKLVEIITKIVIYRATDKAIPFLTLKISNKGVQRMSGDWSQGGQLKELDYLRNEVQGIAGTYERELESYLCLNSKKFPLYMDKLNKEIVRPQNNTDGQNINVDFI